ncbi:hypothetical protein HYALB_00011645 [Hymenoscyphus albidus]|uniref:DNA-(apurinic or apyrimidinic site) endonuclease 2 n=2 Tax=Hymenoscyphus albidus TaxID=595503 RepID=A0A9N9LMF2_9HELO|nr:hypothetical protein HYALB_00011645 [Hymenoscyphus albidus]
MATAMENAQSQCEPRTSGGLRITTWNVNGIRNPFSYQPWSREKKFGAMFDILEADIVVMQETKIQRKDLRDDMVLVPGWDVFFSLPKHKKGYSGVAIYTRNSACAPIRAEEGITGILTPPNSSTSFCSLPEDQQVGGYPTAAQLSNFSLDAAALDSEGRCVILEFPALVLIGVYCPANRDESREEFRIGFLDALDARVRNLVAMGKRVFLTGDLNIIREKMDTAYGDEQLKKHGMTGEEYLSTPAMRMLNQLLVGGRVIGQKDDEEDPAIMWDICRAFHPNREGMFTCWDTKKNARPGNFGSRIDYVLCSLDCYNWFRESNIQEGLMGSDHCPVYAILKEKVEINGSEVDVRDIFSAGMFTGGIRQREWCTKDLLPLSGRLIPEFDRRQSIRDMFSQRSRQPKIGSCSSEIEASGLHTIQEPLQERSILPSVSDNLEKPNDVAPRPPQTPKEVSLAISRPNHPPKRPTVANGISTPPQKRNKIGEFAKRTMPRGKGQPGKTQSSIIGFFKPETLNAIDQEASQLCDSNPEPSAPNARAADVVHITPSEQDYVIDSTASKEGWSKILGKRQPPLCEHGEPCISYLTKKAGLNCGRSFYMCAKPLGPSGQKEKNTEWRCGTFIWSSDWMGNRK